MNSLAGRNVLVTGSTQGVGQAIVIAHGTGRSQ